MYKDRGIIKWAPFDALVGFGEQINEVKYNLGKKAKPILMEDQLQELDLHLQEAIQANKDVEIEYFEDGYLKTMTDKIKKVDTHNNKIIFASNMEVSLNSITNLNF